MYNQCFSSIFDKNYINIKNLCNRLLDIQLIVDYLFCEPILVGRIFGSSILDNACQEIGRLNLIKLGLTAPPIIDQETTVYITSRLQSSGGHFAALIDVLRLSPKSRSIILVTGVCGRTDRNAILHRLSKNPGVEVIFVPRGNHLEKLSWIQVYLHVNAPSIVWLFNHHQDSVAVSAVQPDIGYCLNYYHHGDDRLCLGVYLNYATHFDISPASFHKCQEELGLKGVRYLPLTYFDINHKPNIKKLNGEALITCTAAGSNKVEVDYFISYVDVIPQLLLRTGGRHIHIGHLSLSARWRINKILKKIGVPLEAFVYIPFVDSVWDALFYYHVDIYISSFPYGGGRTMIEVMAAGIPIIIHSNSFDRLIGGFDIVYDGAPIWRYPEDLYEHLKSCNPQFLSDQGELSYQWYLKYHSKELLIQALENKSLFLHAPSLKLNYISNPFLESCNIVHEIRFVGLIKRCCWRLYRRLNSVLWRNKYLAVFLD